MYITPNSTVLVLRGVNIDRDYNHTVRFLNRNTQYDVLSAKTKYTFTPLTYQRTNRGTIRVQRIADDLFDCNYLMFQNSAYGSKWFYAFLDKINYVNDNCSELEYTLDVMQTFLLDFSVEQCFVEREHSITDIVGENTVPEKFSTNEYMTQQIKRVASVVGDEMDGCIIFNKYIGSLYYRNANGHDPVCVLVDRIDKLEHISGYDNDIGVPSSLYIATGFSAYYVRQQDTNYFEQNIDQLNGDYRVPSLDWIFEIMSDGKLETMPAAGSYTPVTAEDVVAAFVYPREFQRKDAQQLARIDGLPLGFTKFTYTVSANDMPSYFRGKVYNDVYQFSSVKNKKLLTSPYIKLHYFNNAMSKDYSFENFVGTNDTTATGIKKPSFIIYGNKIGNAQFVIQPVEYNMIGTNRTEMIEFTENPIAMYNGNALASYMETNKNSMAFGILSSVINGGISLAVSKMTENPIPAVRGITSAATGILGKIAQVSDLKNAPAASKFATDIPLFEIGSKNLGGIFYAQTITAEAARIIDDYFNMYGYATNRVKEPNIFKYFVDNSGYYLRPHWNYIKTSGAIVHPRNWFGLTSGLPAEAEKQISEILDKGITFWNDESRIGNYSLDNSATGFPPT